MTLILRQLVNLIKLLHSERGQNQIAAGLSLGVLLGFAPFVSLQTLVVFSIILIFKVQMGAAMLSAFFFKIVAYLLDPVADPFGRYLLEHPSLRDVWTYMYNVPLLPMTKFNNSIVMGSFAICIILLPFLFFLFKYLILKYQNTIAKKLESTKLWKAIKATKFYELYKQYDNIKENLR